MEQFAADIHAFMSQEYLLSCGHVRDICGSGSAMVACLPNVIAAFAKDINDAIWHLTPARNLKLAPLEATLKRAKREKSCGIGLYRLRSAPIEDRQ